MSTRQIGGSIVKVETGSGPRWRFRIDVDPGEDGRRRQRTLTFRSEKEATEAQARIRSQVATKTYTEPSKLTVSEWLDDWLTIGSRTWRASTLAGYRSNLRPVREAFGSERLQRLTRAQVEALVRKMLTEGGRKGDGRSARTVRLMLTVLGKAMSDAVAEGLIGSNVVSRVRKPAQPHHEMSTWSAGEMSRFLEHVADDPLVGCWHLTSLGLRRGEVLGLRWSDIDFTKGVLHIRQARVQAGREVVVNEPKTARGRRTLPMHPALVAALKVTREATVTGAAVLPLRQRQAGAGDRLVAVDAVGEPLRPDRYSELFELAVKAAGLPTIRLHDCRHTALSLLLEQGVPVHVVAKFAGHLPSQTLSTYAHAQDAAMEAASGTLGSLYATS